METTKTAQYLANSQQNLLLEFWEQKQITYAAADANISWRFAVVKALSTPVRIKVKPKITAISAVIEELLGLCDIFKRIIRGLVMSAMIVKILMAATKISIFERE